MSRMASFVIFGFFMNRLTKPQPEHQVLSDAESAVIRTLLYYDCFKHPLTAEEIFRYCHTGSDSWHGYLSILKSLTLKGLINHVQGFYMVRNDANLYNRRKEGNIKAQVMLPKALKYGHKIGKFPFVKSVCISGSLSKGYADDQTDVDFFIITRNSRLWLCRSLLIAYKKIFLLNSHKFFCVNYFISEDNLEVPDKNYFTATEIATLLPVYSDRVIDDFMEKNQWVQEFMPNWSPAPSASYNPNPKPLWSNLFEKILGGNIGEQLDKYCFRLTLRKWKKKFSSFNADEFDLNMRSRKNVSKHHPNGFQQKVVRAFHENIKLFEEKHKLTL